MLTMRHFVYFSGQTDRRLRMGQLGSDWQVSAPEVSAELGPFSASAATAEDQTATKQTSQCRTGHCAAKRERDDRTVSENNKLLPVVLHRTDSASIIHASNCTKTM